MQKKKPETFSIEDHASVEAICDGIPVYSFNKLIYIYGQSPDFYPGAIAQEDNRNPAVKLKLKKTWEIRNNYIGFCHEMTPRSRLNDSNPYLPIHLIDNDPETIWSSFECLVPDAREEWIRIDLPMESMISSVTMTCQKRFMGKDYGTYTRPQWNFGCALPRELIVEISRDAWRWDMIFNCNDLLDCQKPIYNRHAINGVHTPASGYVTGNPENPDSVVIVLDAPISAKQIRIIARNLTKTGYEGYIFSLNGVEVRDASGHNLALASRGAGVSVSSTSNSCNSDRYGAGSLWGPLQYDIGNKWVKVGSDTGSCMWSFTEHEKGALTIDEDFDAAITEAVNHGVNVMLTLDFKGNWIYENPPRKQNWREARFREINDCYLCGFPHVDESPEMFEGFLRYVEYMVRHFKDRVKYFEIGNEWHMWGDVDWYINRVFRPVFERIRNIAPDAGIAVAGIGGFLTEDLLSALGPGASARDGKLSIWGRALVAVRRLEAGDVIVSVESECPSVSGIALRYNGRDDFFIAAYDPVSEELYFVEPVGDNWIVQDVFSEYPRKAVCPAKGLRGRLRMEARSAGNRVTFIVSDGARSCSAAYTVESARPRGSVGLIHRRGDAGGGFYHFKVVDAQGNCLFADDFLTGGGLADRWDIIWNHRNNGGMPPAAQMVDSVGWHCLDLPNAQYFAKVREFKRVCEALGFRGEYNCSEIYAGSAYPPGRAEAFNQWRLSDMEEAKYYTCLMAGHSCMNIESGPCHISFTGFPHPQSVCRTTHPSQVIVPNQPKPSYYAIRNIATAMDDFYEAEFLVRFSDDTEIVYFTLISGDGTERMLAVFLEMHPENSTDRIKEKTVDISLGLPEAISAYAVDTMNGTAQELIVITSGNDVILKGIKIKDYPLLIKLVQEAKNNA